MDKSQERYEELAEKWLNGTISPEEKAEFSQWYNALSGSDLDIPASFAAGEDAHRRRILAKIRFRSRKRWLMPAVAACVLATGATGAFLLLKMNRSQHPVQRLAMGKKAISPGGNKATLTLADGRKVVLEGLPDGKLVAQQGVVIAKLDTGMLRYSESGKSQGVSGFNTLTTPRGGIFQVQLSDGTHVWLNSATTIQYPTVFSGSTREVTVSGQAYFQVAGNPSRPFVVRSGKVKVKVLGTAFDVMSYEDENVNKTTLTQGSIVVTSDNATLTVHPGQQASLEPGHAQFKVTEPDIDEVLAWKEGRFRFSNTNLRVVMRQIARWYDVSVEYRGDLSDLNLTGSVSRKENVEELLKAFEKTGGVHFTIEDDKIIVTAN
jgi:ferric-dicitrate binding protein FerR (iron transport regulator)